MEYPEYYKILELPLDADLTDIKRQYRKCAKKYHPDLNKGDKEAEEMFKKVKEAYETLKDENKRASYDLSWKKQRNKEQKARKKTQQPPNEQKAQKTTPKQKQKQSPEKKKPEKPAKKSVKKRSFFKILRIFFFLLLICVVLLLMTAMLVENKEEIKVFSKNFTEITDNLNGYLLKRTIAENDIKQAKKTLQKENQNNTENLQDIINFKNSDGYSLLMLSKTADMSKLLIENGADVNYIAPDGATALLLAVKNNNRGQVETLLKAGAKAEVTDSKTGYNALMLSQSNDIAYLLLKAGANPNFVANDGLTPLSKATKDTDRQRLNLLHQFGAQINWSDVIKR